jgi:hypothetical protein
MAIFSQTLKKILQMTEEFKAQLNDMLHDLIYGLTLNELAGVLKDIFCSLQDSLDNMQERFLMADISD